MGDKNKISEYLEVLLNYLANSTGELTEEELREPVTRIIEAGGTVMQTIAEKWMEKGVENKEWDVVRNSLRIGLTLQTIAEITGLPVEKIKQMKSNVDLNRDN